MIKDLFTQVFGDVINDALNEIATAPAASIAKNDLSEFMKEIKDTLIFKLSHLIDVQMY